MRVLIVGGTGLIGSAVAKALLAGGHEVVPVNRHSTPVTADITDSASVRAMYQKVGRVDAVVCAAGEARLKPLVEMTDDDFAFALKSKLMGQVNVVRCGIDHVNDGGSFTLTTGVLARKPVPGSELYTMVNLALEGFMRAAILELPRGIRFNVVSPPWVTETLQALNMKGVSGLPAAVVARAYVKAALGKVNGHVIEPS